MANNLAAVDSTEATRSGVSPIGTTSANSGATAATNSSYAQGAYTSGIAGLDPSVTTYVLNDTDYQGIVRFNTSSAVTVTLNSAVKTNFQASILNIGTGAITLITSDGSPINAGSSSLTGNSTQGFQVFFSQRSWTAYAGTTVIPPPFNYTYPYVAVIANYAILSTDYQIEVTANSVTVTLPSATTIKGRAYSIKNSGTGTVTVATTSAQTIDGLTTQALSQWSNIQLMSNGTGWIIQ